MTGIKELLWRLKGRLVVGKVRCGNCRAPMMWVGLQDYPVKHWAYKCVEDDTIVVYFPGNLVGDEAVRQDIRGQIIKEILGYRKRLEEIRHCSTDSSR